MRKAEVRMSNGVKAGRKSVQRAAACVVAAICSALMGQALLAQTSTGTGTGTDALGIFQGLTQDQQQQIMQRLSGTGTATGSSTSSPSADRTTRLNQPNDQQQTQRRTRRDEDREQEQGQDEGQEANAGPPVFKGLDSLVVEVDMYPLKPRTIDTFPAAAASSYSAQLQMQQTQQLAQLQLQQFQNLAQAQQPGPTQDDASQLTAVHIAYLQKMVQLIRSKNPYQLSRDGVLTLPGLSGIPLGGLTEMQATLRLEVDPMMQALHFRITRLPLRKTGLEGLKPFGYDLFERDPSTFSPVTNIPVPADYVIGSG